MDVDVDVDLNIITHLCVVFHVSTFLKLKNSYGLFDININISYLKSLKCLKCTTNSTYLRLRLYTMSLMYPVNSTHQAYLTFLVYTMWDSLESDGLITYVNHNKLFLFFFHSIFCMDALNEIAIYFGALGAIITYAVTYALKIFLQDADDHTSHFFKACFLCSTKSDLVPGSVITLTIRIIIYIYI